LCYNYFGVVYHFFFFFLWWGHVCCWKIERADDVFVDRTQLTRYLFIKLSISLVGSDIINGRENFVKLHPTSKENTFWKSILPLSSSSFWCPLSIILRWMIWYKKDIVSYSWLPWTLFYWRLSYGSDKVVYATVQIYQK
jgi:hypothetical protein